MATNKVFRLPRDDQRAVIIGSTGGGKTQAGVWQLSERSIDLMPWYIIDFKRDKLINKIPFRQETTLSAPITDLPGVYIVHPLPDEDEAVENFLWNIWNHENAGIFIDEAYMLKKSAAFRALLTQGRSKNIPLITLTQRPVWVTQFVFSEANYMQIFWMQHPQDRKTVQPYLEFNLENRLPPYHSVWYDIGADATFVLKPVPTEGQILERFRSRLEPMLQEQAAQTKIRRFRVI